MDTSAPSLILIVDDETKIRRIVASNLERAGYDVISAADGMHALEILELQSPKPALVLMDVMMPEMDGVLTFEKLHGDKSSPNFETPVIMLTANALAGMREQYMDVGFADYVSKPVRGAKLEEAIRRNLPESLIKPASPEIPAEAVSTGSPTFAAQSRS